MTTVAILSSTRIAELITTSTSHMIAAARFLNEELAVGTLLEVRTLNEALKHVIHHCRVMSIPIFLTSELRVKLRHALQTVMLVTHGTLEITLTLVSKGIHAIRSHAVFVAVLMCG
jgi:hypothetical protein